MSKMWSYGDPIEQNPGYRMLNDGEIIPNDAECFMSGVWEPVGSTAPGVPYMEATEARANTEYHFPMRIKLPEPPAPKSLSLEEILDEVEAKPSEDPTVAAADRVDAKIQELSEVLESLPKHDGHYRTLEAKGAEPIERMEALVCRGIPEGLHRIAKRNLNMAMASKHQDRAGEKSGEAWEKELQKAENYLRRAWSGRWIG